MFPNKRISLTTPEGFFCHTRSWQDQPPPTLVEQFCQLKQQHTTLQKRLQCLKTKIAAAIQSSAIVVREQTSNDLSQVMTSPDSSNILNQLLDGSFQRTFWQQQMEALKKNPKSMCWHTLMTPSVGYRSHTLNNVHLCLHIQSCKHLASCPERGKYRIAKFSRGGKFHVFCRWSLFRKIKC